MHHSRLLFRICFIGTLALSLVAATARSLAFFLSFDHSVGYFDPGVFPTSLYIAIALAVFTALIYAVACARNAKREQQAPLCPSISKNTPLVRITTLSVALAYVAIVVWEIPKVLSGGIVSLALLRLLSAACAAPYFASYPKRNTMLSGVCTHVYCFAALITEYFDLYVTMNSPVKLMQQFAFFAVMLYVMTELRQLSGKPQPVRSVALGFLAVFFSLTNGVSCIAAALVGGIIPTDYLLRALLLMFIGLYAAARLYPLYKSDPKEIV